MATSQNGWTALKSASSLVSLDWVTGRVRSGDVHWIFNDFCKWYNSNIETITREHSWAWAYREIRGSSTQLSNHSSATAIDLNAPKHPLGKSGTFTSSQVSKIRGKLKTYNGAIRWGGDYSGRKDEMHFEINVSPSKLKSIVSNLKSGNVSIEKPNNQKPNTTVSKFSVKTVKERLKKIGFYKGEINTVNDTAYRKAVSSYQRAQVWNKLTPDGIWGSKTEAHYQYTVRLQSAMNEWKSSKPKLVVDGSFGNSTLAKVRDLQTRNLNGAYRKAGGRVVDGIPGAVTAKMLGIKYL